MIVTYNIKYTKYIRSIYEVYSVLYEAMSQLHISGVFWRVITYWFKTLNRAAI